jgi:hypothetical protein
MRFYALRRDVREQMIVVPRVVTDHRYIQRIALIAGSGMSQLT